MKIIEGKTVVYDGDDEFYSRQSLGSRPHDKDRIVRAHIAEALRFLMYGGRLDYTQPPAQRADPDFGSNIRILDVGCRDGWSLECLKRGCMSGLKALMAKKRFNNAVGMELSCETVRYARSRARNVTQGDIRNCVLGESSFDVIFTRHCLEHLDDPMQALRNIKMMLKPNGILLAIVPKESQDIDPEKSLHSYQFRDDNDLADLATAAGLSVTCSFRRNEYPYRMRKYWYKLTVRPRHMGPELWILAVKPGGKQGRI